jgi:hypothetical protein
MTFSEYTNKYGKKLVLETDLLNTFLAMKDGLDVEGIEVCLTDGWRGEKDQDHAKETGHSNATFGHSPHNFGVAFDCAPVIDGKLCWPSDMTLWGKIAEVGQRLGLVWGGGFHTIVDLPHFEKKNWRELNLTLYSECPPTTPA